MESHGIEREEAGEGQVMKDDSNMGKKKKEKEKEDRGPSGRGNEIKQLEGPTRKSLDRQWRRDVRK